MANIQHLYRGMGDPNDNPSLELTGDAVGNHIYQDITGDLATWVSWFYEEEGRVHHGGWSRLTTEHDLANLLADLNTVLAVEVNQPRFIGQIGYSDNDGTLFIAMEDPDSGYTLKWRSMGTSLGDWYQEPA